MIEKLTDIKGIGPKKAQQLEKLGIMSPEDLLYYYPRRYIDFTVITPLKEARMRCILRLHSKASVAYPCKRISNS